MADCAAGDLQHAHEICDRFTRARGRFPWLDMTPVQRERALERHREEVDRQLKEIQALMTEYQPEQESDDSSAEPAEWTETEAHSRTFPRHQRPRA